MIEIDFFASSAPRSAEERKKMIVNFQPDAIKHADFMSYGYNYYDNPDYGVGYGGYKYDGRHAGCVDKMIQYYDLGPGSTVLEIGCAKGFVLYEFHKRNMRVSGIDISSYAVSNAIPDIKSHIIQGSCETLPWESSSFDLVYSKETLPHLTEPQLELAISEAQRVSKSDNIFLEIGVSEDEQGCKLMKAWDETHQSIHSANWWRHLLKKYDFEGQANFKLLF